MKQQKAYRRSQRTYRLVSSAFAELIVEKPYEEILVQDILDRADIGRTTFYAHYFDKEDVLNSIVEQELEMLTHQITRSTARQRVVPSLELFEHVYHSQNQQFLALMRSRAGEPLWEALQAALCRAIETALSTLCAEKRSPPILLPVVSQYLAGALTPCSKQSKAMPVSFRLMSRLKLIWLDYLNRLWLATTDWILPLTTLAL